MCYKLLGTCCEYTLQSLLTYAILKVVCSVQVCHESCGPWTITFMRLPLSMRMTSPFRPNWKGRNDEWIGNHFQSETIDRWTQLRWTYTSTWLLSTENHLKRTPRWTTAGIILNSRGVVTFRVTHKAVSSPYIVHDNIMSSKLETVSESNE
jgi:hypothetical protein